MFGRFFKKEKSRVFLGVLAVAPRTDVKRIFDQMSFFRSEDLDAELADILKEIFSLPLASDVEEPLDSDLVLDVVMPKFQLGEAINVNLVEIGFPILWRPKVTVSSRLYYLKSNKTKATFSVTEKMGWGQYINRMTSWRSIFRLGTIFGKKDLDLLLYKACHKLLVKMQKMDGL